MNVTQRIICLEHCLAEFGECSSCSFTVPDMCLGQKLKNEKDYLLVLHSFISLAFNI